MVRCNHATCENSVAFQCTYEQVRRDATTSDTVYFCQEMAHIPDFLGSHGLFFHLPNFMNMSYELGAIDLDPWPDHIVHFYAKIQRLSHDEIEQLGAETV